MRRYNETRSDHWKGFGALALLIGAGIACGGSGPEAEGGDDETTGAASEASDSAPQGDGSSGGDQPQEPELPGTDDCRPPPQRVWQLGPAQLAFTYERLTGVDPLTLKQSFERYASVGDPYTAQSNILNASSLFATELLDEVKLIAEELLAAPAGRLPACAEQPPLDEACAAEVVDQLGAAAFRRPVSQTRKEILLDHFRERRSTDGAEVASIDLVRRILAAPEVVFRYELGGPGAEPGLVRLTPYELADALAYSLTDAPPDEALLAAAVDGSLHDSDVLREHAERLLATAPPRDDVVAADDQEPPPRLTGLLRFVGEWVGLDQTRLAVPESPSNAGHHDERILRWLQNEVLLFARHVFWEDDAALETLLSADYTFYSKTLAEYYGRPVPPEDEEGLPLPTEGGRLGLLMQGSFLTGHPTTTLRGVFIRSRLLCQPIVAPPNADMNLEGLEDEAEQEQGVDLSPREVRALHLEDPQCSGCHKLLDPLGFPFDVYDDLGQLRTEWDGFPIDTQGEVTGTTATNGQFSDAPELVQALADSPDVATCFVEQLYAYVHGRPPTAEDTCYLDQLKQSFLESGGDVRALLVEMVTNESMQYRVVSPE